MTDLRNTDFGTGAVLGGDGRKQLHALIPNTAALHEDTTFQIYREFIPRHFKVEITVFYREPGQDKMRIDAEFDEDVILEEFGPDKVRVTYWGKAVRAIV